METVRWQQRLAHYIAVFPVLRSYGTHRMHRRRLNYQTQKGRFHQVGHCLDRSRPVMLAQNHAG